MTEPSNMKKQFYDWTNATLAQSPFDAKTNHLMSLVASLALGNQGAASYFYFSAKQAGATEAELAAVEGDHGQLVLLALDDVRITGIVPQHSEIELDDDLAAGAIPDAEPGLDQAAPGYLLDQAETFQHLQRRGMRGRCPRAVVDTRLGLEHPNLESLLRERQRGHDADRAAARDDDGSLGLHLPVPLRDEEHACGGQSVDHRREAATAAMAGRSGTRASLPVIVAAASRCPADYGRGRPVPRPGRARPYGDRVAGRRLGTQNEDRPARREACHDFPALPSN